MTLPNPIDELIEKLPANFTPGPWNISRWRNQLTVDPAEGLNDGCIIADLVGCGLDAEANAALIALAPEMAAALSTLQEQKRALIAWLREGGWDDFGENNFAMALADWIEQGEYRSTRQADESA